MGCVWDDVTVRRDLAVAVPAADVWRAISEPDELGSWLADEGDLDLRPGGRGWFREGEAVRAAVVEEVEPGHRLAFRWWPEGQRDAASLVTLTLVPEGPGARLIVVEQPLTVAARVQASTGRGAGWDARLDRLRAVLDPCGVLV